MSCSARAPAGPGAAPFWEMLALLAREPGMEWLELSLAEQAATFSHCGRGAACRTVVVAAQPGGSRQYEECGAAVAAKCRPCSVAGLPARAAVAAQRLPPPWPGAGLWLWVGGERIAWRLWLPPGSVSLVLLEFLCEAGAFGGRPRGSSSSWAGKYAAFWREYGREFSCPRKHSLGPWPLKTLSLLECSGDSRLWRAYLEGLKKFLVFRKSMGMPAAWPIPEEQVRGFLAVESLYSSSKTLMYVAELSYLSKLTGNPDPLEDPITHCMVIRLKRQAGILRGEMVAKHHDVLQPELLYLSDLQLTERRAVFCLHTSPVGQESHVISLGLSGEPWVCPVLALQSYVTVRSQLEGPLFMHSDNTTVTKREFLTILRWALRLLGLCPEQYGVHSFWLGTAVTAVRCGYPGEDITRLARWPCMIPERS